MLLLVTLGLLLLLELGLLLLLKLGLLKLHELSRPLSFKQILSQEQLRLRSMSQEDLRLPLRNLV